MEPTKQKNIAQPDKKDLGCLPTIKQPSPLAVSLLRLMVARENSTGGIPNNKKITLKDCNKIAERIKIYILELLPLIWFLIQSLKFMEEYLNIL